MEEEKEEKKLPRYPSWVWKPWRTVNWKWLKKPWRKKGCKILQPAAIKMEVGKIVNWITFWKKVIEGKANLIKWVKPNVPLTLWEACNEFWIAVVTFWSHLNKFPEAKELYKELKQNRREYLKELSEANIQKWLSWEMWMTWKEIVDASFKLLEKTDKAYQPKVEIESKSIWINIHKSTNDIMSELSEILWQT